MKNIKYIFILLSFLSFHSSAQKTQAPLMPGKDTITTKNLDEVIISATRTNIPLRMNPAATTVVTQKVVETIPRGIAADEVLGLVPGVRIDNQANGSRIHMSIRGQGILNEYGLRGIKVLLDGLTLNDPSGFVPDLYDVDWETVNQIEVLRGPAASFYGGGSNAGVVNIITNPGGEKPVGGELFTSVGSNGFWKLLGQVDGKNKDLNYRLSYSHIQGNGYRDHTAFFGNNAFVKGTWTPSSKITITPLMIYSDYFNQNAEGLNIDQVNENPKQANPDAIPMNEYQKTRRLTASLVGQVKLAEGHMIQFNTFYRMGTYKESGSKAIDNRSSNSPGGSVQYNWDAGKSWFRNHLSLGTDLQWQTINQYKIGNIRDSARTDKKGHPSQDLIEDTILLANQTINQRGLGAFLINRMDFGKKFSLMICLRYDNITNELKDKMNRPSSQRLSGNANFDKLTGRVGVSYAFAREINLYANWGQGFLPPSTNELASNPVSFGGFNQSLTPSTSNGEEIGIRGTVWNRFYYELTFFYLQTANDFYRYREPDRPLETFYGNIGASDRFGIETYLSVTPVDPLTIQLAYTFSDFKYSSPDSIKGNYLPNSPAHQLTAQVDYHFLKHFNVQASSQWQTKWWIYTDDIHYNTTQNGFNLYNLRLGYNYKIGPLSGELSFYVKNIFDQEWMAFTEPDPDGNCYQPGPGREYFANLRINF